MLEDVPFVLNLLHLALMRQLMPQWLSEAVWVKLLCQLFAFSETV